MPASKKTHCIRGHERKSQNVNSSGGCKACHNQTVLDSRARHSKEWTWMIQRKSNLKALYNITLDQYNELLRKQDYRCANPGCRSSDSFTPRRMRVTFAVDHDHSCCPGKTSCGLCIRGLLCNICNPTAGLARDNVDRLRGLATYIDEYNSSKNTRQAA